MAGDAYLAYDYPVLGTFWTILIFFLWFMWIVVFFRVIIDIFRDRALSGWGKAGWILLVMILPFLGVFIYVIARGRNMAEREIQEIADQQAVFDAHIRQVATSSSADELAKLSELKAKGDITEEEFQRAKEKLLS